MATGTSLHDEAKAVATHSHEPLHLLQLPAELRNKIFEYAFRKQYIFILWLDNDETRFYVAPHNYPATPPPDPNIRCYPLSDLLAKTSLCRQMYFETAPLPMLLITFKFHHSDSVSLFADRILSGPIHAVRSISLGLPLSLDFTGLEHVVVETKFWGLSLLLAGFTSTYSYLLKKYIMRDVHVEFM